jgi:hypothetical protein
MLYLTYSIKITCCAFWSNFVWSPLDTCLKPKHPKIQKHEIFCMLPIHCSYGVDSMNIIVVVWFNTWTNVLIALTHKNFGKLLACNMLHVFSMIIILSHSMIYFVHGCRQHCTHHVWFLIPTSTNWILHLYILLFNLNINIFTIYYLSFWIQFNNFLKHANVFFF